MRGPWLHGALALVAGLATVGLLRSLLMRNPLPAADLPEPLRRGGPTLAGYRSAALPTLPARRERDRAWGPRLRWHLLPLIGTEPSAEPSGGPEPLVLELVVRRSRMRGAMAPDPLAAQRLLRLGSRQQVALGWIGARPALQTCLVGRGPRETGPTAAVQSDELTGAAGRWRQRLEGPLGPDAALRRELAIQLGLRLEERWECLQVTLRRDGPAAGERSPAAGRAAADAQLVGAWRQLTPQLQSWGERWQGLAY